MFSISENNLKFLLHFPLLNSNNQPKLQNNFITQSDTKICCIIWCTRKISKYLKFKMKVANYCHVQTLGTKAQAFNTRLDL